MSDIWNKAQNMTKVDVVDDPVWAAVCKKKNRWDSTWYFAGCMAFAALSACHADHDDGDLETFQSCKYDPVHFANHNLNAGVYENNVYAKAKEGDAMHFPGSHVSIKGPGDSVAQSSADMPYWDHWTLTSSFTALTLENVLPATVSKNYAESKRIGYGTGLSGRVVTPKQNTEEWECKKVDVRTIDNFQCTSGISATCPWKLQRLPEEIAAQAAEEKGKKAEGKCSGQR